MKPQPQPPEPRPLHRAEDPSSVIFEAEAAYGSGFEAELTRATRDFLTGLSAKGIPHLLVGAMAMLQHVDGRPTRDIDLILAAEDVPRLPGFTLDERNEWFATGAAGPVRIDLLFTANPLFAEVLEQHAEDKLLLGTPIRCASPLGIIILKLFALPSLYRQGNIRRAATYETDILKLHTLQPVEPERVLHPLRPHLPASDIKALRSVLADIQRRIDHQHRF